jgi:hypothetical protein
MIKCEIIVALDREVIDFLDAEGQGFSSVVPLRQKIIKMANSNRGSIFIT